MSEVGSQSTTQFNRTEKSEISKRCKSTGKTRKKKKKNRNCETFVC